MEHRYHPRIPVALEADLFNREQPLGRVKTKNLSLTGVMIQDAQALLKRNDLFSLRIRLNGAEQAMRGLLIYTNHQHAGIMLIDMDRGTSRTLFDFLKEQEAPKSAIL